MKKIFLIFLIVIFAKSNIIAASDESKTIEEESKIAVNESSIKTYEDKITFGVFSMYPSLYLYLINVSEGGSTESIVYAPNSGVNLGFMVAYKGFSLGFSWDFNNYGEEDLY